MPGDNTLAATVVPGRGATSTSELLARGTAVGRYLVLGRIGVGGMGVVYAAHDPELDRKVALKLVLLQTPGGSDRMRTRLLREAQALAKLAHPNVVTVHDVGMFGEQVWIAMEFVAGQTLGAWAQGRARAWPESLRVLTDAARGVAAAHAAGLVHRDLKPDNVMIGEDGRVRVMDFGLAHGRRAGSTEHGLAAPAEGTVDPAGPSALAMRLTRAGALQGTPAYMAPEQWMGEEAEAAADQFGWSVMAWEVLYGERPFAGETVPALTEAVVAGRRRPPRRGSRVPGWLRRIVERGLATDASQRWPTMAALVAALEHGRTRSRRRTAALVLSGVAALGAGAEGYRRWEVRQRVLACEATGAVVDRAWSDEARQRVRDAFAATGVTHAQTTADRVLPALDQQAAAWRRERTETCLNAEVRGRWSEDLAGRAGWCLEDQMAVFTALVEEFGRAGATTVEKAATAVAQLKPAAACMDEYRLRRQPSPPTQERGELQEVRAGLSRASSLRFAGNFTAALEEVRRVRARASEGLDWPPISAAAHAEEAFLLAATGAYPEAEAAGIEAYFEAVRAGAWEVAADVANHLVFIVGYRRVRHAEGRAWARHAEMALLQIGDPMGLLEAERLNNLATVQQSAGAYAEAQVLFERALAIWERTFGPDHILIATSLNNLSVAERSRGAYAEARSLQERALAIRERALGPEHPDVAMSLGNLAQVHDATGAYAEARALQERALAIREKALGPEHPDVAMSLGSLADTLRAMGAYSEALALAERALKIREKALGPDHTSVAGSLNGLAYIHKARGEYGLAQGLLERALKIREKALGPDHPNVATILNNLGEVHLALGTRAEARALLERAFAIRKKALAPDHPHLALTLRHLGALHLADGRPRDALPLLERAVAIFAALEGVQEGELAARFTLAQALVAGGGDRGRALAEARAARDGLREAGAGEARQLAEVERWLVEHDPE